MPTSLQKVMVVFIPKPTKGDYSNLKSIRQISLPSFSLKDLEGLVEGHIRGKALRWRSLDENQHANQRGSPVSLLVIL